MFNQEQLILNFNRFFDYPEYQYSCEFWFNEELTDPIYFRYEAGIIINQRGYKSLIDVFIGYYEE